MTRLKKMASAANVYAIQSSSPTSARLFRSVSSNCASIRRTILIQTHGWIFANKCETQTLKLQEIESECEAYLVELGGGSEEVARLQHIVRDEKSHKIHVGFHIYLIHIELYHPSSSVDIVTSSFSFFSTGLASP